MKHAARQPVPPMLLAAALVVLTAPVLEPPMGASRGSAVSAKSWTREDSREDGRVAADWLDSLAESARRMQEPSQAMLASSIFTPLIAASPVSDPLIDADTALPPAHRPSPRLTSLPPPVL